MKKIKSVMGMEMGEGNNIAENEHNPYSNGN